jgi:hypothetical protein
MTQGTASVMLVCCVILVFLSAARLYVDMERT